jgi:hypothetical protein
VPRYSVAARIETLDPERDRAKNVRFLYFREFPWDLRTAGKLVVWHRGHRTGRVTTEDNRYAIAEYERTRVAPRLARSA